MALGDDVDFSLLTESTFHTFWCYSNINSVISESIIIRLAALPTSLDWMQYEQREERWRADNWMCFYCPQALSRGTGLADARPRICCCSKRLISFQPLMVGWFRTATLVSAVKMFPARNFLRRGIESGQSKLQRRRKRTDHCTARSFLSQRHKEDFTAGTGAFVCRNDRGRQVRQKSIWTGQSWRNTRARARVTLKYTQPTSSK